MEGTSGVALTTGSELDFITADNGSSSRPFLMKELPEGSRAARGERLGESRAKWTGERILVVSEMEGCKQSEQ